MFKTENAFVRWVQEHAGGASVGLRLGIGDDAALVSPRRGHHLILTSDLSIEGVHFLRNLHPPRAVGHRALARSLSDVAAMGGIPRYALLSIAISKDMQQAWLQEFYSGIFALAGRFGVAVVGGDTALVSGSTAVDVTVVGEVKQGRALRRSGARPGDQLFVSGRLGLSALGLRSLQAKAKAHRVFRVFPSEKKARDPIFVHLFPEPRVALGRFLSQNKLASALIDLSDGLSTDLHRLCEASRVGARIWADRIPAPSNSRRPALSAAEAMYLALNGGEDYELLFAVPRPKVRRLPRAFQGVPLHWIGEVQREKKLHLILSHGGEEDMQPAGYDHFARLRFRPRKRH